MNKLVGIGILACVCIPWAAYASGGSASNEKEDAYVATQFARTTFEVDGITGSYHPRAVILRLGQDFNRYLAIEGRAGAGVVSDEQTQTISSVPVKVDVNNTYMYGLYGVATLPLIFNFEVYGVLGLTRGEAEVTVASGSAKGDENDFSYGAGAGWKIDDGATVSVEYMSYIRKSGFDASALAIGLSKRF